MNKIRYGLIVLAMLLGSFVSAEAGVSIGISTPNLSIGINLPMYPQLAPVPGYPVYYAPQVDGNYFFYDGMYWVYQDDNWYASAWYNGPWSFVEPTAVPLYVLRIPVRYYRQPPPYFRGWQANAPPRWGQHWGPQWEQHRRGWDKWNRKSVPRRAPQPTYQRQYTGDRYPRQPEQQHQLRSQKYRYQPREREVREHYNQQGRENSHTPARNREQNYQPERSQDRQERQQPQHERQQPQHEQKQHGQQQRQPDQQDRQPDQGSNRGHGQGQQNDDNRGKGHDK